MIAELNTRSGNQFSQRIASSLRSICSKEVKNIIEKENKSRFSNYQNLKFSLSIINLSNKSFITLNDPTEAESLEIVSKFSKKNYLIYNFNEGDHLLDKINSNFRKSILSIINGFNNLNHDYIFSPLDSSLYMNITLIVNISYFTIEKIPIRIYFLKNGVFVFNKSSKDVIYEDYIMKIFSDRLKYTMFSDKSIFLNSINTKEAKNYQFTFPYKESTTEIGTSIDNMVFWILHLSVLKMKEFVCEISREIESINKLYLNYSAVESLDILRRVQSSQKGLNLLRSEVTSKISFIDFLRKNISNFRKNIERDIFGKSFKFLVELNHAKLKEIQFQSVELTTRINMIENDFKIIVKENMENRTKNLFNIIKILTIMSIAYDPLNDLTSIFGMNLAFPFKLEPNYVPLFLVIFFGIGIFFLQLYLFKKRKWV